MEDSKGIKHLEVCTRHSLTFLNRNTLYIDILSAHFPLLDVHFYKNFQIYFSSLLGHIVDASFSSGPIHFVNFSLIMIIN